MCHHALLNLSICKWWSVILFWLWAGYNSLKLHFHFIQTSEKAFSFFAFLTVLYTWRMCFHTFSLLHSSRFWHRCALYEWQPGASRPRPPQGVRPRAQSREEPGELQGPAVSCIQHPQSAIAPPGSSKLPTAAVRAPVPSLDTDKRPYPGPGPNPPAPTFRGSSQASDTRSPASRPGPRALAAPSSPAPPPAWTTVPPPATTDAQPSPTSTITCFTNTPPSPTASKSGWAPPAPIALPPPTSFCLQQPQAQRSQVKTTSHRDELITKTFTSLMSLCIGTNKTHLKILQYLLCWNYLWCPISMQIAIRESFKSPNAKQ